MPLIFDDRPLFSELFDRVCDELHHNSNENVISVEGLLTRINQAEFFENAYIISLLHSHFLHCKKPGGQSSGPGRSIKGRDVLSYMT